MSSSLRLRSTARTGTDGAAVPDGKRLESSSWARFLGLAASVGAALASLLTLFVWPAVHSSAHDLPLTVSGPGSRGWLRPIAGSESRGDC